MNVLSKQPYENLENLGDPCHLSYVTDTQGKYGGRKTSSVEASGFPMCLSFFVNAHMCLLSTLNPSTYLNFFFFAVLVSDVQQSDSDIVTLNIVSCASILPS